MRSHRLIFMIVLVLAAVLGAALPVLAAGNTPYFNSGGQTLIYTASSGRQPQGTILGGQYIRLATDDCPMPARTLADGQIVYACPRPVKLPPLPRPPLRLP